MAKLIPFKKEHLKNLDEHVYGLSVKENITEAQLEALEKRPHSYSFQGDDGEILGCGGVIEYWPGRAEGWAVLRKNLGARFFEVHTIFKTFLREIPIRRFELVTNVDFPEGIRWAYALGFTCEAPLMKSYGRDGKDCMLFAKVKE